MDMESEITRILENDYGSSIHVDRGEGKFVPKTKRWPRELVSTTAPAIPMVIHSFHFVCTWSGGEVHTTSEVDASMTRHLSKITYDNMELLFDKGVTLRVDISFEEGYAIAFNERFGIYGFGKNEEKALLEFNASFIDFYKDIVESPPEELGNSTLEFKKTLMAFATLKSNE